MIKLIPLFSGSKGNCALVQTDNCNILLDAGYQYRQILSRLDELDLSLKDIGAIVITHEHGDHVSALSRLAKSNNIAVYAPSACCGYLQNKFSYNNVTPFTDKLEIADVVIEQYLCSHDALACCGYKFTCNNESVASVTDTGCVTASLTEFLAPCKGIMLESNHDVNMLQQGNYSYVLKKRILSNFGHLSNDQTAQVIMSLKGSHVKQIALAHLSEQNNTKEIAFNSAVNALGKVGLVEGKDVKIYVTDQYVNRIIIC
ncbi:MAG: MBL fold metallo-hydrolase [Clostridia bacterium]|nr:MBL fold metallo-hydrolase [Clostridia bacterium]